MCEWKKNKKQRSGLNSVLLHSPPPPQQCSHDSVSREQQVRQCELHGNRSSIPGMSTMLSLLSMKAWQRQAAAYIRSTRRYVKGTMQHGGRKYILFIQLYVRAFPVFKKRQSYLLRPISPDTVCSTAHKRLFLLPEDINPANWGEQEQLVTAKMFPAEGRADVYSVTFSKG